MGGAATDAERERAGAVNVLEAVRGIAAGARVVWVTSCEVYGVPDRAADRRVRGARARANPYAVSKASRRAAGGGLRRVARPRHRASRARSAIPGPGQLPIFLLSSLARQAAEGRRAGVGTAADRDRQPATRRDFTDVREWSRLSAAGDRPRRRRTGVYNVSSGTSISAAEQVALLAELIAPIAVDHEVDPARVRAHEIMDLRGDHSRLTAATGWEPEIPTAPDDGRDDRLVGARAGPVVRQLSGDRLGRVSGRGHRGFARPAPAPPDP